MITNGFTYVAILLFIAAVLVALEEKATGILIRFFSYVPAIVLCYLIVATLSSLNVWDLDATKPTYDALRSSLIYTLVFTMLLGCDLRKILKLGPKMLLVFFCAAVSICISFLLTFGVMKDLLGPDSWKGLGALCGSWLGGSGNMLAVQAALGVSESDMGYVLIMDAIDYAIWIMFLLWAIPLAPKFNKWTGADASTSKDMADRLSRFTKPIHAPVSFYSLFLILGFGLLASAVGQYLGAYLSGYTGFLDSTSWTVLSITAISLLASMTPIGKLAGASEVSNVLLYSVMALLASRVHPDQLTDAPMWIFTGLLILIIHGILMAFLCKLFRIDLFTAGVASLANVGGTASAPVLAATCSDSLVPVGILMSLMGYIIGTPGGIFTATLMQMIA